MKVHYNPALKKMSQKLRRTGTRSEIVLWENIKRKQLGYQFSRQKPVKDYIVDFYCYKLMLIIEIDGDSHIGKFKNDFKRQKEIEELGFNFLRFENQAVLENTEAVINTIKEYIEYFENSNR